MKNKDLEKILKKKLEKLGLFFHCFFCNYEHVISQNLRFWDQDHMQTVETV